MQDNRFPQAGLVTSKLEDCLHWLLLHICHWLADPRYLLIGIWTLITLKVISCVNVHSGCCLLFCLHLSTSNMHPMCILVAGNYRTSVNTLNPWTSAFLFYYYFFPLSRYSFVSLTLTFKSLLLFTQELSKQDIFS